MSVLEYSDFKDSYDKPGKAEQVQKGPSYPENNSLKSK
jgi:hypothetical protein